MSLPQPTVVPHRLTSLSPSDASLDLTETACHISSVKP